MQQKKKKEGKKEKTKKRKKNRDREVSRMSRGKEAVCKGDRE
jgi:hypothetical protein